MAMPQQVKPVKLLVAILWADLQALQESRVELTERYGPIDVEGCDHPFDMTDYYKDEMGSDLQRRLVAFERLVAPEALVQFKLHCNAIEDKLGRASRRRANLDVGYLDHNKLVLASVKYAGQKIHLGQGIYADMIARYGHGRYQPFEWTFPDFRDGRYDNELAAMRSRYLQQLRDLA